MIGEVKLKEIYAAMLKCRMIEERLREPRLQKRPSAAAVSGRQAIIVGAALDLRRDDWLAPWPQDQACAFLKGMPLTAIFPQRPRRGQNKKLPWPAAPTLSTTRGEIESKLRLVPASADPASQLNHAVGVALVAQARKTGSIVMAFCEDSSGPSWIEGLGFAATHCVPLLLVTHGRSSMRTPTPRAEGSGAVSAGKAGACGAPVIPVDAQDVVAIYRVAYESIHKARHGGGPTWIRTQEVSMPGRDGGRRAGGQPTDCIGKMEAYLAAKGLFSPAAKQRVMARFDRQLNSALAAAENPSPE